MDKPPKSADPSRPPEERASVASVISHVFSTVRGASEVWVVDVRGRGLRGRQVEGLSSFEFFEIVDRPSTFLGRFRYDAKTGEVTSVESPRSVDKRSEQIPHVTTFKGWGDWKVSGKDRIVEFDPTKDKIIQWEGEFGEFSTEGSGGPGSDTLFWGKTSGDARTETAAEPTETGIDEEMSAVAAALVDRASKSVDEMTLLLAQTRAKISTGGV